MIGGDGGGAGPASAAADRCLMRSPTYALILLAATAALAAADPIDLGHRDDLTAADRAKVVRVLEPTTDFGEPRPFEQMAGGATTSRAPADADAFTRRAVNLPAGDHDLFLAGSALFRKVWVPAPSSTLASDGLGPLFNARSCDACHLADGRGRPLVEGGEPVGLLFRLGAEGGARPHPLYGRQIQDRSAAGLAAEGRPTVVWTEVPVTLGDGTVRHLRRPAYGLGDARHGPLGPGVALSPRIATPMIGLGLLEAIHAGDVLAGADPDDADGDGISGRANHVGGELGRFGWKASVATVAAQSAEAFGRDLGLSNPGFTAAAGDCTSAQTDCLAWPSGVQPDLGPTEVSAEAFDAVVFYARHLAVPVRRDWADPTVLDGKRIFHAIGCAACHRPAYVTRRDADPALAFQLIWPYTDLLLHDMGEGLADGVAEGLASGREWRTPPLWGLGLTRVVDPEAGLLHDGRARDAEEAVLWHDGEARRSRDAYADLPAAERAALLAFLNSL